MKYKLVYKQKELGAEWRSRFTGVAGIEILSGDICQVECDALVSPANSFGFMDGGLDLAISERFGWDLQKRLQDVISRRPLQELLVGEALIIPTNDATVPWLISAPTMRVPMRLRQSVNAYLAMKAILIAASTHSETPGLSTVAIPGLGAGCGALSPRTVAHQMWRAYKDVVLNGSDYPDDFGEAQKRHVQLNPDEINIWDS